MLVAPKVQIGPQLPADIQAGGDSNDEADNNADDDDAPIDRSIYTDGVSDPRGWYEDGAYMAAPDPGEVDYYDRGEASEDAEEASEKAIHDAYLASLLDQYIHLRSILNTPPPSDALSRLPRSTPVDAAPFGRNSPTTSIWSRRLRNSDPLPLQLALMSKDSVLRVLRVLLGGKFLRRGYNIEERTSRWLWALLARLPDRGELNYAEIGWIRDLGRRAVLLGRSLAEMAALRDELEEGALGVHEGVDRSSSDEDVVAGEVTGDLEGAESPWDQTNVTAPTSDIAPDELKPPENPEQEDGEIADDDEDVAMEISSNMSVEEGEAPDDQEDLEGAKARLLSQLDASAAEEKRITAEEAARERARMNMRATVNMILTVAGEFYGQRDLLEFREPFVGM